MEVEDSRSGLLELDCGWLHVMQPSHEWTVSLPCHTHTEAGARLPNPKQAPEMFGSFHTERMCVPSMSLCVSVSGITLCVSHTPSLQEQGCL